MAYCFLRPLSIVLRIRVLAHFPQVFEDQSIISKTNAMLKRHILDQPKISGSFKSFYTAQIKLELLVTYNLNTLVDPIWELNPV